MPDRRQRHLAVVDDDGPACRAVVRLLASMGFAAAPFGSAEAFLEAAGPAPFHCLLVDVQLGGMSGPELSMRLTALGRTTPIIYMSAAPDAEEQVRSATGRAQAVLPKPLDAERLRVMLETVLSA